MVQFAGRFVFQKPLQEVHPTLSHPPHCILLFLLLHFRAFGTRSAQINYIKTLQLSTPTAATSPLLADQQRLLHEQSRVTPTSTTFCFSSWSLKFPSPWCFRSLCVAFSSHAEAWSSSSNNIFAASSIMFV